jgi:hypothetical protein
MVDGSSGLAESFFLPNTQSFQMTQNVINVANFQPGGTSHHRATKATGIVKMINLMPVSTP